MCALFTTTTSSAISSASSWSCVTKIEVMPVSAWNVRSQRRSSSLAFASSALKGFVEQEHLGLVPHRPGISKDDPVEQRPFHTGHRRRPECAPPARAQRERREFLVPAARLHRRQLLARSGVKNRHVFVKRGDEFLRFVFVASVGLQCWAPRTLAFSILGAHQIVTALLEDDLNGPAFVVKRVGGDKGVEELHLRIGQQRAALGDLAVLLFSSLHQPLQLSNQTP